MYTYNIYYCIPTIPQMKEKNEYLNGNILKKKKAARPTPTYLSTFAYAFTSEVSPPPHEAFLGSPVWTWEAPFSTSPLRCSGFTGLVLSWSGGDFSPLLDQLPQEGLADPAPTMQHIRSLTHTCWTDAGILWNQIQETQMVMGKGMFMKDEHLLKHQYLYRACSLLIIYIPFHSLQFSALISQVL